MKKASGNSTDAVYTQYLLDLADKDLHAQWDSSWFRMCYNVIWINCPLGVVRGCNELLQLLSCNPQPSPERSISTLPAGTRPTFFIPQGSLLSRGDSDKLSVWMRLFVRATYINLYPLQDWHGFAGLTRVCRADTGLQDWHGFAGLTRFCCRETQWKNIQLTVTAVMIVFFV